MQGLQQLSELPLVEKVCVMAGRLRVKTANKLGVVCPTYTAQLACSLGTEIRQRPDAPFRPRCGVP